MSKFHLSCSLAICLTTNTVGMGAETASTYGRVELVRDQWGTPHVFADSDEGAMYGLGYATAEDRGFQMVYSLRIVQGRLSEVIGEVRHVRRNETSVDNDRKMRAFGFYRTAQQVVKRLDNETVSLMTAYCAGVNHCFSANPERQHPLFERLGVEPEPWTPADCIASWWHMGQFFATDGTRDLLSYRNLIQGPGGSGRGRPPITPPANLKPLPPDDAVAVVRREDVSDEWVSRVHEYAQRQGMLDETQAAGPSGPKFSHAWVVGGKRTTTGSSVLVSDPQTPVRNPSMFYEFHVVGRTFNARGIGVPGSPVILIGFSDKVAWGLTALGADQADLFRLKTDPARPDEYFFDGQWRKMDVSRETIQVRGGQAIDVTIRQTTFGPVVTPFCFARPDDGDVALKRIPLCDTDRETVQAAFAMLRADDADAFSLALHNWRFPSVNVVFGDRTGNIGYWTLAAIPVRSSAALDKGRAAHDGTAAKYDWQDIVPYDLLPHVINPKQGYLATANHRAIGSWYPIPLGAMTGSGGDTLRSWRLRERLLARSEFRPEDVLDIHFDGVNPARREIVRAGLHLKHVLGRRLSPDAAAALEYLESWYKAGASSRLESRGAEVAVHLNTFFRFVATDLAYVYGGGESGLAYFLKTLGQRIEADAQAGISALEQEFIDSSLATAWQRAREQYGPDASHWNEQAQAAVTRRTLGYFESLDGYPSLDTNLDLALPPLANLDGGTIQSQLAQSYTQYVPMHDPDQAQSILPVGASELPDSPYRTSTHQLWGQGKLHPAPLSKAAVSKHARSSRVLSDN